MIPAEDPNILIDGVLRDKYWELYHRKSRRVLVRLPCGVLAYVRHRLGRWLGVQRSGLFLLQILFVAAVVTGGLLTADEVYRTTLAPAPVGHAGYGASKTLVDRVRSRSPLILACCALIIFVYKHASTATLSGFRKSSAELTERRQAQAVVLDDALRRYVSAGDVQHDPHRLADICECVRRDVQEFLCMGEHEVFVAILQIQRIADDAFLPVVGRDKPKHTGHTRHALASFAFEAARLRRPIVFHDLRTRLFREYFKDTHRDYRSVYAYPLFRPDAKEPYGILTVNFRRPYVLWPFVQNEFDRRLLSYERLICFFAGDGGVR